MTEIVGVGVKVFIELDNKLCPCNIPMVCIFVPFPPLLAFKIQIENNIVNFGQLISNAMQRKIMLHLSDPTHGIGAIKFIDLKSMKMMVMMKGVGVKIHRMRGINTIWFVRGGRT
jgi:hypothetical protein